MAGELINLSPDEKVQQALELIDAGHSKTDVAMMLYNAKPNNSLSSLRKLMLSHGYCWDKELNRYVPMNKQEQTKTHEQEQTATNEAPAVLTQEDIRVLKELVLFKSDLEAFRGALQGSADISIQEPVPEAPLTFTKFRGLLQPTTLQLHREVWEALDAFCKQYKLSKKAIVNEAIWDFLKKWGDSSDAEN